MNLRELYQAFSADDESSKNARALLSQTHWFLVNSELDPKTNEALPQSLSAFLAKVARPQEEVHRDRLWRITEHSRASMERLFRTLNESPRREQAMLPIHAVRELDASSFIKLSNRPGRNIREKLAGKPYLQAVRRYQSVNLPENRLLKVCVTRLAELLELRRDSLPEKEDDLLAKIQSWLRSAEAMTIGNWDNLPPNNTLLAHRDYRRVWDAWRWLQTLDDDITLDFSHLQARSDTVNTWKKHAQIWAGGRHLFTDIPVFFDFEQFEIRPWNKFVQFQNSAQKISRKFVCTQIFEPTCIDLSFLRPCFATSINKNQYIREAYVWQQWNNHTESVDIELFNSDAIYLHSEATTITSTDLFFSKDKSSECFDRAARAFATNLHSVFKDETLIWLVPDVLNDFELEVLRRNLNARFPKAEPLPRSVAAAVEQVDYSKIKGDGFPIVVIDTVDGKTCVTKLIAKFDKKLNEVLPETRGYYWERCPSVIIQAIDSESVEQQNHDIITVDDNCQWRDAIKPEKSPYIDPHTLKNDSRIGSFAFCINLVKSPVTGGIQLHYWQQSAGDVSLWCDQIPELSIKVRKDGWYQPFHLVTRGTTIQPIRGLPVQIPITENFTLPAGREFYQFPLFQEGNDDEFGFSARLDSHAFFPLKADVKCKLNLTFEYGADEPYKLVFEPLDTSFAPIRATWKKTTITDAPAPDYPEPMSWNSLQNWKDAQGNQINLLTWLLESLSKLHDFVPIRSVITISSSWKQKTDSSGTYWFAFGTTENGTECYCNTRNLLVYFEGNPNSIFPIGIRLFCNFRQKDDRISVYDISTENNVSLSPETKKRIIFFRERSLQNRMSLVWSDSRSLQDFNCPIHFKNDFTKLNNLLLEKLPQEIIEKKILFLHACMHKDAPNEFAEWISIQSIKKTISDPRVIGFALGDVSEPWQKEVLFNLLSNRTFDSLRVFAYAVWRERHFIEYFNRKQLYDIAKGIVAMLSEIRPCPSRRDEKDKWTIRNWIRSTAEPLELLLGLLRSRASSDSEIKVLLQPHQKIAKELAEQVEHVAEIVALSNINLFSRLQINIQKPEDDRTPDLLYALRLYLTGDDGANAIHITSVSDSEGDSD